MATDKVSLGGVRVSPDVMKDLKYFHELNARRRGSTKNRITFSSWIEELLSGYISQAKKYKGNKDSIDLSAMNPDWGEFMK